MPNIIDKIQHKLAGKADILEELVKLPSSELHSFLLELFRLKSLAVEPAEVLNHFRENRFVRPSGSNLIQLKTLELEWLRFAADRSFKAIALSPLAPFGTCSAVGFVNQNNVVSALRGTEVVSDATNVLALEIAHIFKQTKDKQAVVQYATTHRHVRGQYFTNPNYTAHFTVFCLASGGFDTGSWAFERVQLSQHISTLYHLLSTQFNERDLSIVFYLKAGAAQLRNLLETDGQAFWRDKNIQFKDDFDNKYYKNIQFKIFLNLNGQAIDLADGGDVDWTQKLMNNRKHRLFISGVGLELVEKLRYD